MALKVLMSSQCFVLLKTYFGFDSIFIDLGRPLSGSPLLCGDLDIRKSFGSVRICSV